MLPKTWFCRNKSVFLFADCKQVLSKFATWMIFKQGKYMRKIVLILIFTLFAFESLVAVPAKQTPITITQPDGRVLTYILKGDEVVSWCESSDGYTLLANGEGVLCYAMLDKDKNLVSSGVVACNREERNVKDLLFLKSIDKKLFYSDKQMEKFAKIRQSMFGSAE